MDNNFIILSLLILFMPLMSFILQLSVGRHFGERSHFLALPIIFTTFIFSAFIFYHLIIQNYHPVHVSVDWISSKEMYIPLGIHIDGITAIMLCVVSLISSLVHLYSTEYMKGDKRYSRYFAFLGLFTFSMNGIVLADSLIMMYLFWELVGLSSFLLIGFWFEKDSAANASKKAFLTNRVGDIGMFIGMMIIFYHTKTFQFHEIPGLVSTMPTELLTCAGLLVFMGAVGKSAQFPLHIWLPDAMEGPTPVSALIHAATMVAAGVYMTVRIFAFLTVEALAVIAIIGAVTALMAAIIAVTRNDIKAVLAYSTISQLGYMVMGLGVGAYVAGFFHLVTHAMFKACLFLCSGSVIHAMHHSLHELHDHDTDPQDMNNMGGLRNKMPITFACMLIATFAIAGVPLFSGFLSKDAILAGTLAYYHQNHGWAMLIPIAGFGAALITAFYMFRLIFLTFFGNPKNEKIYSNIHESPKAMTVPLVILSVLSFAFIFTLPNINPLSGSGWFDSSLHQDESHHDSSGDHHLNGNGYDDLHAGYPDSHAGHSKLIVEHYTKYSDIPDNQKYDLNDVEHHIHEQHDPAMFLSLFVAFVGILLSGLFYFFNKLSVQNASKFMKRVGLFHLSRNKFYIDSIYNNMLYKPFLWLCSLTSKLDWNLYDQTFIDSIGRRTLDLSDKSIKVDYNWLDQKIVDGSAKLVEYFNGKLKHTQSGVIQNYLMAGILGIVLIALLFQQI